MHVDRCRVLGHDPYLTPIFDPTYQYYWDPVAANWQPYNGSGKEYYFFFGAFVIGIYVYILLLYILFMRDTVYILIFILVC